MKSEIISYIVIRGHNIWINDIEIKIDDVDNNFLKSIYKYLDIKYPKFYKMDELSKLGFIASELLLRENKSVELIDKIDKNRMGLVLQNSDSTIDVDTEFYSLITQKENHHPSPALFVYTLPNILIGEIAIYNKFRGENALFVSEEYNPQLGVNYINSLLDKKKIDACMGGWINANSGSYEAFLYIVKKTESLQVNIEHIVEEIKKRNKK